jgi:hypothetical protein
MKKLVITVVFVLAFTIFAACTTAPPAAPPTPEPTPTPLPTATPPPMADHLILYGDLSFFAGRDNPESCILKSRYQRGENVGFRMTAIDPLTGEYVESAELVVHLNYGGSTEEVPMRYRGTGDNPRPGFWTAKWVVPDDAPIGIVKYTITATDDQGRTGEFTPFQVESSELTIVE